MVDQKGDYLVLAHGINQQDQQVESRRMTRRQGVDIGN
jgi:hypothetical protein